MKVCVIGGGVVGCATAYELARQGHEVVLLDAAAGPGTGTSFANGAQLSYSYVEPLAGPATLRALPALLLQPDSPLRFRLRADPVQWRWGLQFLRACTHRQARQGTHALLALGARSQRALDAWMAEAPLEFGWRRNGKLVICPDEASLARQRAQVELQAGRGAPQQVLGRAECLAREPILGDYKEFAGGVWTPGECVGDPYLYCQALAEQLRARGGSCLFNARVERFALRGSRCDAVETSRGNVQADAFVLAAGLASRRLAQSLGEALPLYPVKGYSLTLRLRPGRSLPGASVTDLGRKMVFAPLGDRLRVAAMAEFTGEDLSLPPRRLEAMMRSVEAVFPGLCAFDDLQPWAGLRPATPTSVPVIRPSRIANVLLNVGHGALGFTLAAGSAQAVADMLPGQRPGSTAMAS